MAEPAAAAPEMDEGKENSVPANLPSQPNSPSKLPMAAAEEATPSMEEAAEPAKPAGDAFELEDELEEEGIKAAEPAAAPARRKFSRLRKGGPNATGEGEGEGEAETHKFVQCDKCDKWREVPVGVDTEGEWDCTKNTVDEKHSNCEAEMSEKVKSFLEEDDDEDEGGEEEGEEEMPERAMYDEDGEIENEAALLELYAESDDDDEEDAAMEAAQEAEEAAEKDAAELSVEEMQKRRKALNAQTQRLLRETATTACIGKGKEIKIQSLAKSSVLAKIKAKKEALSAAAPKPKPAPRVTLADLPEFPVVMEDDDDDLLVIAPSPSQEPTAAAEDGEGPGVKLSDIPLPRMESQSQSAEEGAAAAPDAPGEKEDAKEAAPPPPVHPMFANAAKAKAKAAAEQQQQQETQGMELRLDETQVDEDPAAEKEGDGAKGAAVEEEGVDGEAGEKEEEELELSEGRGAAEEEEEEDDEEEMEMDEEERARRKAALKAAMAGKPKGEERVVGGLGGLVDDEAEMSEDEGHSDDEPEDEDLDRELDELQADDRVEKQADEERRASAHQQWLDMQDQDDMREVMKGFESGWKRPRKDLNGALGDEDEGTDRSTRARLRARGLGGDDDDGFGGAGGEFNLYGQGDRDDGALSDGDEESAWAVEQAAQRQAASKVSKVAFSAAMLEDDEEASRHMMGLISRTTVGPRRAPPQNRTAAAVPSAMGNQASRLGKGPKRTGSNSFLGRTSSNSQGPIIRSAGAGGGRSFVFGRDDSSSNFATGLAGGGEDSQMAEEGGFTDGGNTRTRGLGGLASTRSLGGTAGGRPPSGPTIPKGASLFSLLNSSFGSQDEEMGTQDRTNHNAALKAAVGVRIGRR